MGYYAVERIEKSNVEVDNIWSLKLFFFFITPAGFELWFPHKHQLITLFIFLLALFPPYTHEETTVKRIWQVQQLCLCT